MAKLKGGLKTFVRDAYLFGALGKIILLLFVSQITTLRSV
jgi:hypothetical protein